MKSERTVRCHQEGAAAGERRNGRGHASWWICRSCLLGSWCDAVSHELIDRRFSTMSPKTAMCDGCPGEQENITRTPQRT